MNDPVVVHVLQSDNHACEHEFCVDETQALTCLLLVELLLLANVVAKVASIHQVAHEVQVLSILERIVHVYEEPTSL